MVFKNFLKKFTKNYGVDLGTANTIIYSQEKGIIVNEPTIVAVNIKTDQIIAVGHTAKKMLGKNPPHIQIIRPLIEGVISDIEVTEKMIKYFIEQGLEQENSFLIRPQIIIGVPLEVTEVERKAVEDAALASGAKEVFLIEQPMAAAIGARLPVSEPTASMIVDIGGGTTDIAVISLNGIVTYKSLRTAGDDLTQNIIQFARDEFNLLIGERVAEDIKIKIGSAAELDEQLTISMKGRDLISGLPKEIIVTDHQIRQAMSKIIRIIIDNIKLTLENTPPELVADIYERGVLLSGGGALIKNIDKAIENATQIHVTVADDPITAVVRGTALLIENQELLEEIRLPTTLYQQKKSAK
jgi:rod shape-determining protein MreB and related proteins